MTAEIQRPAQVQINGWNGELPNSGRLPERTPWAQVGHAVPRAQMLAPGVPVDPRNWQHPEVGWGLVLPDDDALAPAAKIAAEDAPPAIRKLLQARPGSPVLRWSPALGQNFLRRYYTDGPTQDLSIGAPKPGTGFGRMPRYLLIFAPPATIPWAVQYALNMSTFVGRLDLEGDALDNYVAALIADWDGAASRPRAPVVWSVDHGTNDITWLMERALADELWRSFENDADLTGRVRLKGAQATAGDMAAALAEHKPGLVVTTSHGMTGPLHDQVKLKRQLGAPVDVNYQPLRLEQLAEWQPGGAIWYAHACCAAGSDRASRYADLLQPESSIGQTLAGVAKAAGAMVAPLPRALLGAPSPLRAFVGHVEPTFDWTLRDPSTQQVLTDVLCKALYCDLFQQDLRTPIGYALRKVFAEAGAFYGAWQEAIKQINAAVSGARDLALYRQLVAMDRQTLVILGDPTVSLPSLN